MKIGKIDPWKLASYRRIQSLERRKGERKDYILELDIGGGKYGIAFYSEKNRDATTKEISDCFLTILDSKKQAEAVVSILTTER